MPKTKAIVPREALEYFRLKGLKPGFDYRDVWQKEHAASFTVAKAMKLDVLTAIRDAVDDSLANGKTFTQFQKDLQPELEKKGWWGKKDVVDPKTGAKVNAQLGSPRRLKVIYRANGRSNRAAGQFERAQRTKRALPFFIYLLGPSEVHRKHHVEIAGTILPVDHPFWDTHFPPNGWGCKCHIRQITKREAEKRGGQSPDPEIEMEEFVNTRTGEVTLSPTGISPAWATNPGKARMEIALKSLGEKAISAPEQLAGEVIKEHMNGDSFPLWLKTPEGNYPVAAMSNASMNAIQAKQRVVWLSKESFEKQQRRHPELTADDYRVIPRLIDQGTIIQDGERTLVFFESGDVWYKAAVKTTGDGGGNFLTSFIRTGPKELARIQKKGRVVRP
jgi:hypothetical protein